MGFLIFPGAVHLVELLSGPDGLGGPHLGTSLPCSSGLEPLFPVLCAVHILVFSRLLFLSQKCLGGNPPEFLHEKKVLSFPELSVSSQFNMF